MKNLILALLAAFLLSAEFPFYVPVALCLALAVALIAVSSVAAARTLTAHLR